MANKEFQALAVAVLVLIVPSLAFWLLIPLDPTIQALVRLIDRQPLTTDQIMRLGGLGLLLLGLLAFVVTALIKGLTAVVNYLLSQAWLLLDAARRLTFSGFQALARLRAATGEKVRLFGRWTMNRYVNIAGWALKPVLKHLGYKVSPPETKQTQLLDDIEVDLFCLLLIRSLSLSEETIEKLLGSMKRRGHDIDLKELTDRLGRLQTLGFVSSYLTSFRKIYACISADKFVKLMEGGENRKLGVWFWTQLSLILDWTENDLDESTPREVRQCLRSLMRAIMLDADDKVIQHELKRFDRELSKVPTGHFGDNRESITYAIRRLTGLTE